MPIVRLAAIQTRSEFLDIKTARSLKDARASWRISNGRRYEAIYVAGVSRAQQHLLVSYLVENIYWHL